MAVGVAARSLIRRRRTAGQTVLDTLAERVRVSPRTIGILSAVGVPLLVLGVLARVVVGVLPAGGTGQAGVYAEFVDPSTGSYLDVQLDPSASTYGAFSAVLAGGARIWPRAAVESSRAGTHEVELFYEGPGYAYPPADPTRDAARVVARRVLLRLDGRVDPAAHTASVDVWVDGTRHHIGSTGQVAGADIVAENFLAAMTGHDWNRLYDIAAAPMVRGTKRSDFVTDMAGAGAAPRVTHVRPTGPMTFSTSAAGVSYARLPLRLTYGAGAGATTNTAALVLVVDGGAWKVLSLE